MVDVVAGSSANARLIAATPRNRPRLYPVSSANATCVTSFMDPKG